MHDSNFHAPAVSGTYPWRRRAMALAVAGALLGSVAAVQPWRDALAAIEPAAPGVGAYTTHAGFADIVGAVRDAVVNVSVESGSATASAVPRSPHGRSMPEWFARRFGQTPPGPPVRGAGSGFVIDAEGLIVTNHHVIEGADRITVTLRDGRRLPARVRGSDPKTDLALLEVDVDAPLAAVRFADSDATRVGDWVVAVGNPFGLGGTVTAGIVSARGRDIGAGPYDDFLQIDAPINRGNSGGPLFDSSGRVVGINSAIFSPSGGNVGIGFAIPASLAEPVIAALRDHGTVARGWLGVQVQAVDESVAAALGLATAAGALVSDVVPSSPADAAGVAVGDVILEVAGDPIDELRVLPRVVAAAEAGSRVPVVVWRAGARRNLEVQIARDRSGVTAPESMARGPGSDGPRLGVALASVAGPSGARLVVQAVQPGSAAETHGLQAGDVILRVGDEAAENAGQVADAVAAAARTQRPLLMLVERQGARRFLAVELAAPT